MAENFVRFISTELSIRFYPAKFTNKLYCLISQINLTYEMYGIVSQPFSLKKFQKGWSLVGVSVLKITAYQNGLAKRDTIQLLIAGFDVIHVDFRTRNHNPDQRLMPGSSTLSKTKDGECFSASEPTCNKAGYGFECEACLPTNFYRETTSALEYICTPMHACTLHSWQ